MLVAKKRDERFASYATLRDALTPFSSQAREPAPLGMRFVAGMLDVLWSPTSYERLIRSWGLNAKDSTSAVTWVIDLLVRAVREEQRPPVS